MSETVQEPEAQPTVEGKLPHNHPMNFGRYVADCPRCQQNHPNGPPKPKSHHKAKPAAPVAVAPTHVPVSEVENLKAEIAGLKALIQAALLAPPPAPVTDPAPVPAAAASTSTDELVRLMLRRESEAMLKEEEAHKRMIASREDMLRIGREGELLKQQREANCQHTKENGRTAIYASQIFNDGMIHPFCCHCMKTFPPRRPAGDQMPTSVDA